MMVARGKKRNENEERNKQNLIRFFAKYTSINAAKWVVQTAYSEELEQRKKDRLKLRECIDDGVGRRVKANESIAVAKA